MHWFRKNRLQKGELEPIRIHSSDCRNRNRLSWLYYYSRYPWRFCLFQYETRILCIRWQVSLVVLISSTSEAMCFFLTSFRPPRPARCRQSLEERKIRAPLFHRLKKGRLSTQDVLYFTRKHGGIVGNVFLFPELEIEPLLLPYDHVSLK